MRTVLVKGTTEYLAIKITIELVQFAKNGYEVKGTFEYPYDKDKTVSYTVTPNQYHAKIVFDREVNIYIGKGYVTETVEV